MSKTINNQHATRRIVSLALLLTMLTSSEAQPTVSDITAL